MQPYILTKRNSIHIIDPKETLKGIIAAKKFIAQIVGNGKDLLLVGTKRQARKAVEDNARRVGMHFVNDRWLGGALTNFRTIRSRLARLEKLEKLEADGLLGQRSKKEDSRLRRELAKIKRNLDGIRKMDKLPGVLFVVDAHRETNALREAHSLGIPTVAIIDTDSDPDLVDIPIPGNDDAMRAIEIICHELCDAAELGKTRRSDKSVANDADGGARRPRRGAMMARPEETSADEKPTSGSVVAVDVPPAPPADGPAQA
jgi:small subunit ribosomal protein S2